MTITPADAVEVIRLWPDGPPSVIEGVPAEIEFPVTVGIADGTTFIRNISEPTLTVFAPTATSNGIGVVVIPGGGWTINAWTHEGLDVAEWLTGLGYTAFLLKYRVRASEPDQAKYEAQQATVDSALASLLAAGQKPAAISDLTSGRDLVSHQAYEEARSACADDGRRAVEIVRREAARFGIRPEATGLIGFSAGAFLAVDVAMDPKAAQVAFVGAIYGGETLGAKVPDDAPPLFIAVAQDDILGRIVENLHADWSSAGRSSELHVFARGAHGFGMVKQGFPSDRWTDLFAAWVDDLGLSGRS